MLPLTLPEPHPLDLNQLYFDHQILLMRAHLAVCDKARLLHRDAARSVARAIASLHRASGATALLQWEA